MWGAVMEKIGTKTYPNNKKGGNRALHLFPSDKHHRLFVGVWLLFINVKKYHKKFLYPRIFLSRCKLSKALPTCVGGASG